MSLYSKPNLAGSFLSAESLFLRTRARAAAIYLRVVTIDVSTRNLVQLKGDLAAVAGINRRGVEKRAK